ncbi:MAG: Ig-like domain-containing protein [Treponema sp.]|nr:Ig-like domain-containing protein [Treponema sp.]
MKCSLIVDFLVLSSCMLFASCGFLSFKTYELDVLPQEGGRYFCGTSVDFVFSESVEHYYAQKAVKFMCCGQSAEAGFAWKGDTLCVTPEDGWIYGYDYSVSLEGQMHLKNGSTFVVYERTSFIYGDKNKVFSAKGPDNLEEASLDYSFKIEFNRPVQKQVFRKYFSFDGSEDFVIQESDDLKSYTVKPLESWLVNKQYFWKLNTFVSDDNYILDSVLGGNFKTITDTQSPELVRVCPVSSDKSVWYNPDTLQTLMSGKKFIGLEFSKPMDFSSVKNAFSITPQVNGSLEAADDEGCKFIYSVKEPYLAQVEYTVLIKDGARDTHGLYLGEGQRFTFTCPDEYLKVTGVKINGSAVDFDRDIFTLKVTEDGVEEINLNFLISFSEKIEEQNLKTAFDKTTVKLVFPYSALTPVTTHCHWNSERTELFFTCTNFSAATDSESVVYQLKIAGGSGGIYAGENCYMEDSVCVNFVLQ